MKRKGLITHLSRFDEQQRKIFIQYLTNIINNVTCKKPKFLNGAYSLRLEKIKELFGSVESFRMELKGLGYDITTGESVV
jgi:hypothetical protein